MRLIDADALIERIKIPAEWEYHNERRKTFNEVLNYIKKMPTAYDVEAVVAELEKQVEQYDRRAEEHKDYEDYYSRYYSKARSYENAISIVRGKE